MRNVFYVCMLLVFNVSCQAQVTEKLSPQDFKNKIESETGEFIILDLRTDDEVAQGKVPGAEQMDFYSDEFESALGGLDKETTYFIYCKSGGRSGQTFDKMKEMGFNNVYEMEGGMLAWMEANFETE